MTAPPSAAARRPDTSLLLVAGTVLVVSLALLPSVMREQTRDWIAYEQAAERLRSGAVLYDFDLASPDEEYYLYPPGMAAAWAIAGSPEALLLVKVAALIAVSSLAGLVAGPARAPAPARASDHDVRRDRWVAAVLLAGGAIIWPPDVHDLVLANVMALYVGAVALLVARRGWPGAVPLGIVLALALKPAAGPLLLWLAISRPRDAARVVIVAAAASAVVAGLFGVDRYVEYVAAIPDMVTLAAPFSGNVGLVTVSRELALVVAGLAYVVTGLAALRLDPVRSAAIALASMLLAQPTIGFNYAGLLFPALVLLWSVDRAVGTIAFVGGAMLVVVSPVATAVAVVLLSLASAARLRGRVGVAPAAGGA